MSNLLKRSLSRIMLMTWPLFLSISFSVNAAGLSFKEEDYHLKLLGKFVFFDKISTPAGVMSCASCHDPRTGGTGADSDVNLHQVVITGANPVTLGNLKPPTNAYASFIRPFEADCGFGAPPTGQVCGGNFWDGRAEGRGSDVGGALFPAGATKHIGEEVFQGNTDPALLAYAKYFGPISDQALNPMPNHVEQNIDRKSVCEHVQASIYRGLYLKAWGEPIDCSDDTVSIFGSDVAEETEFDISFKRLMLAVGAWQHSSELNSFSSKRDRALRAELKCLEGDPDANSYVCNHENYLNSPGKFPLVGLTDQENLGHDIFYNRLPIPFAPSADNGGPPFNRPLFPGLPLANCGFCHSDNPGPVGPGPRDDGSELLQTYADDAYHNIGTPRNPEIPELYLVDHSLQPPPSNGLADHTGITPPGFWKTPTLRNVDKRKHKRFIKAYTHNGWFKSLESIVHFYNTANVDGETAATFGITRCPEGIETEKDALANNCWPAPEFGGPVGGALIGNLGMNAEHEAALVAYMKTLTDRKTVRPPLLLMILERINNR